MVENPAHGDGLPAGKGVSFTGGAIMGFVATAVLAFVVMIGSSTPVVRQPMMQPTAGAPATEATTPQGTESTSAVSATAGADLSATYACAACHSTDGVDGPGPTWLGVAGSQRTMENGDVVLADRDYLVQSIVDPSAHIVEGFLDAMPKDFGERLSGDEIDALVGYIESLGS